MKRAALVAFSFLLCALSVNAQTTTIDSLLRVIAENKKDTSHLRAINDLCFELSRTDIAKQKEFIYKGLTLSKQLNSFLLPNFYSLATSAHQTTTDIDSAKFYLDLLQSLSANNPKDEKAYAYYNQTAGLFYKNLGKPKEALPYMIKTLDVTKDSTTMAGMMLNIGNIYNGLGEIQTAAKYHLRSLSMFEKVRNKKGQSFAAQGLGNDYMKMQQWEKSGTYFEKSLKLKTELGDKRGILTALGGVGNIQMELGNYDAAITTFEKAYQGATEMKIPVEQGHALHQLAQVHRRAGNIKKSKSYYEQALVFAKQTDDKPWVAWIESSILKIGEDKKSKETMEAGLLKTLQQYEETGDRIGIANSLDNLSSFYSENNEFEKAYATLRRSTILNDSARGQSVDEQLRKLEEDYANEKHNREMELFRKDQELKTADLERREAVQAGVIIALVSVLIIGLLLVNRYQVISKARRRAEIETMRNAIARDLHDDIGSTLSSINILSQLAIRQDNESSGNHLGSSKHFSKIAEQSSRMMESMSDIVWSISPGNDSLEQVVSKMKEFAAEILEPKNITYQFKGEDSLKDTALSLDKRKNLFLIFKEAVNNAAKYSGATDLEITFERQGNKLSLSISDNGGGFEPETVKAGNGLKNMRERASALSARFDFVTRVKEGTRVALELPLT